MTVNTIPRRHEIPIAQTWNRESVFESPAAWQTEYEAVQAMLPSVSVYQGRLAEGPALLLAAFEVMAEVAQRGEKLALYAGFSSSVDTADPEATARLGQAQSLTAQTRATFAFMRPEVVALGAETVMEWVESEPRLALYHHYFADLFRRQGELRSAEVEAVLGMMSDPLSTALGTANKLLNADMRFAPATSITDETHPLTQGTKGELLLSRDRELRRTAWENYADRHLEFKNTLANGLLGAIKRDIFFTRVRGHESSLAAALFRDNIPTAVFYNLIDTFKRKLPIWHRYWRVRRKALGVDVLQPYDIWAPITPNAPYVPFEQAVEWIAAGLQPLGEGYVETLRRGCLEERWVDYSMNEGKRNGAFSSGCQGTYPFIMMSYIPDLNGVSTLAHELGHSMHSYLTWQNQPYVYSDYSLFVAEVASNFNQAMTRAYLFEAKADDRDFQIALIEEAMSNFHRYFFIMPTLARFELEMHERVERGRGVTADDMIALMADLFEEGYGGELDFDRERVGITWAQFGHLYANFYVFQYATGISGAHALSQRLLAGVPDAAEDYLGFLSAGGSVYALDALQRAGVDLRTPEAVEATFDVMERTLDRLEALTA